jgi:hypothetical protein
LPIIKARVEASIGEEREKGPLLIIPGLFVMALPRLKKTRESRPAITPSGR